MVLAVTGERAGSVVDTEGLVVAGACDDAGAEIDEMRIRRAMRVVARHAGGHGDMLQMARPGRVDEVVTLETERRVASVGRSVRQA